MARLIDVSDKQKPLCPQGPEEGKLGIMKKSFNFLCKTFGSFGKTSYLCTRKPKGATNNGAVVQLVRILACHARGRGFEPRPHRKEENQKWFSSFFRYPRIDTLFLPERQRSRPCSERILNHISTKINQKEIQRIEKLHIFAPNKQQKTI